VDGRTTEFPAFVENGTRINDGNNVCDDGAKSSHHYDSKFPNLKGMILVAVGENMPPGEWGERAIAFWYKWLMPMKGSWPVEWKGNMPLLRIVAKLEDI
jgi:hypothetical protein